MVGWSRRNRAAAERHARWLAWFSALPVERQREIEARYLREDKIILTVILTMTLLFLALSYCHVEAAPRRGSPIKAQK